MQGEQHENIQFDKAIAVRLLKMLLCDKVINQATYDKVVKISNFKGGSMK